MWLELAVAALALIVLAQTVALWRLHTAVKQARVSYPAEAFTDVPTSMLVEAIGRLERGLQQRESPPVIAPDVPSSLVGMPRSRKAMEIAASTPASHYDLARELLREGARVEQLVERCGLSRGEAELLCHLHEAGERMAAAH